ncbi:acyltransferase family protein [Fluviicola taffensis]|uniref:Acyltransferase 3 n=1 Tax=Fluviicola taffensis (strain DSM 16823 / NCIMB 13979 / RW262) TaxID=755732 RepID=F2ICV9_FLUTR|nr:acyltransferase [Fluviicola taffensis]AEA43333.1 acyltransferase 3 [Fluviicola taffensis DSM 16823]
MNTFEQETKQLGHIEALRALAALMVLVFHLLSFNRGDEFLIENAWIRECSKFGAQGVELFYLISGFVIFYSLTNTDPKKYNYFRYLQKRFLRISPPFWGILFLICLLAFVWKGDYPYSMKQILENATLTVDLFHHSNWMNPIFITLKVEFLFYGIIGFLILIMRKNKWVYTFVLSLSLCSVFFFHQIDIIHNIPFFVAGIACSEIYKSKNLLINYLLIISVLVLLGSIFSLEDFVIVCIGIVLILWIKLKGFWIEWLGKFSYSLYLTHGFSGGLFLFIFKNENYLNLPSWLSIVLAVVVAIAFAYCYYQIIEKKAIRWSKKIHY